jgi:hypothetical protein
MHHLPIECLTFILSFCVPPIPSPQPSNPLPVQSQNNLCRPLRKDYNRPLGIGTRHPIQNRRINHMQILRPAHARRSIYDS